MGNPIVTVIIPTFNRGHMINRSIESVKSQTFRDWELIIVDDASIDNTEEIVRHFMKENTCISYIKHEKNKGGCAARNTGINKSKGDYIALLDDDDIWYPHKLEKQLQKFNESSEEVGLVYTGYEIAPDAESHPFKNAFPEKRGNVLKDIMKGNFVGSPTPLIKKDIILKTGLYDENLKSAQDWDLWIRIACRTEFEYNNEILARYLVHGKQISVNMEKKIRSMDYIINKYNYLYLNNKRALANIYKKTAVLSFMNGKIKDCRKRIIKGLFVNPLRVDLPFHLLLSFLPSAYMLYIEKNIVRSYGDIKLVY